MASEPDYVFTRDYLDNNRINLQHYLWIQLFGYLTHPKVSLKSPNLRIADVGTGTCIWLTDLAAKLPKSVQLDGLDVSFGATPPRQWLPSNISLRHFDVLEDVADDLVGAYDIVHIRLFSFVLRDADIENVVERLKKLLTKPEPGGFLQWGEPDVSSFRISKTHEENKVEALTELLKISQGQDTRLSPKWVPQLPQYFSQAGLEEVEADVKDSPMYLALAAHECNLLIHELLVRKTQNKQVAQALECLLPEVSRETRGGSCWEFTRWTVIGRKKLE
ncbi:hypothetical protein BS50DRAFT_607536 [Corynespora cassiicola Philippines]|uniref:S-adenosyl-L-methionine-dependent methyltransferase n=1 Tax=Corynespora cassiicola Philippines TaxID=1448308 RepID=A0A2T2P317_CORCC|nr:hypothetical protein BS50DRAFT_607536 [Corynespora cassiicola Philippines]